MSQSKLCTLFYGALVVCVSLACGSVEPATSVASVAAEGEDANVVLRQTAMPEMGVDRLGSILNRYYKEGLGGAENWERVVSLRVAGRLKLSGGEFDFNAYQKKPHYIKMTIHGDHGDIRMGYDGRIAWHAVKRGSHAAEAMEPAQARRFIHGARFGNHLLYPYATGKRMEYLDTVPVDGTICHQIRVTLDTEYQVDYFVDVRTYLEIKVVNTDLRTGTVSWVVYEDYIREFGMPIAQKVVSYKSDEWVSTLELDEVKVNSGIMPWMFKMPK
ncbi:MULTISPECIES: hypothetical protein [unclassified Lentimonas]|uniref:hypothetical protein n=1 Tax=unclassified Lentimonas TaxID=2630993 RepID=UPI0013233EC6|nr:MULTISPECIES: hypothetical protein [unclassified Lentimonas]CAA6679979.1 Unannotated [Lentimonas sp. CC4]CAA6686535.1 Unannotated [Lentimonas sp. CC6]CAA7074811.1 Unannotated [Lentimonas sp. CC4]CAA7169438.1 Unannotated [Lentimonas sp. CC21]CAA7180171.1 Unannotated [Lentimonas sp. CC8]